MIFSPNKLIKLVKKNNEIFLLFLLIIFTIFSTTIYNNKKLETEKNYKEVINNIYFQKSLKQIFDSLKPRYKSIDHKISIGETFDKILNNYSIPIKETLAVKKILSSDYNLSNLKSNLDIKFTIDLSNNKKITSFLLPVSRTEKILLTRNIDTDKFDKKKIITNLNKKIIFKEGRILQSLYKTAIDLNIQPNIIIEFARIYGFQVDFQRDIRKNDNFQIMYEVFEDDNGKVLKLEILFLQI